jgi:hypothetical protein
MKLPVFLVTRKLDRSPLICIIILLPAEHGLVIKLIEQGISVHKIEKDSMFYRIVVAC